MIYKSEKHNPNYLAKIVQIKNLEKHPNADRLQVTNIDFQNVITGPDTKIGDIFVFFPIESTINLEYLSSTNSFRKAEMNRDKEASCGFFEEKGRVRALKLRGEKSFGYLAPIETVEQFAGISMKEYVGEEFDMIGDIVLVKKYVIPSRNVGFGAGKGKKPRISRLIENQVRLHVDTENLRKNAYRINSGDYITVSYKYHGTSFWVSNVLVKRPLGLVERFLRLLGVKIDDKEYDYVYGSRKVVKNGYLGAQNDGFYKYDIWKDIKEEIKDSLPKGYTLYGECVGFLPGGTSIQGGYDYGCGPEEKKILVYRVTFTNSDGVVFDLSTPQIQEFCHNTGLNFVHVFYHGIARDMYPDIVDGEHWQRNFVQRLEKDYNDKNCFICKNTVPEEGVVLRKEKLSSFEAYKLKSFSFLEYETKLLDSGEENIEDQV